MSPQSKTLLQIPQGTEGFYFNEAHIHNQVTHKINSIFHSWGYLPVKTPVFDFYDIYHSSMDQAARDRSYRLVDREGDLLMLRSDVTLFLAKQIGLIADKSKMPVRVCYSDTILRHENTEDISRNEFFQIGAELVGKGTIEGEMEIILLLTSIIELLEIDVCIHIGSHKVFDNCFSALGDDLKEMLRQHLLSRQFHEISNILKEKKYPSWEKVVELLQFIGSPDEFRALIKEFTNKKMVHQPVLKELAYLDSLFTTLQKLEKADKIRVDLSEIGTQHYHTGTAFQVYMSGIDSSIASGGRYDGLLKNFGMECESVGFSLLLRKVEPFLTKHKLFSSNEKIESIKNADFCEAYKKAEQMRKKGKTVTLW